MIKKRTSLLIIFCVVVITFTIYGRGFAKTTNTVNKNLTWFQERLNEDAELIKKEGEGVHFIFKGFFHLDDYSVDFTLEVGEEFFRYDDHGEAKLLIKEIQKDGVVIEYTDWFNHRSFGKNLETIDKGKLKLLWKEE